jgi:uncharacterized membrane protein
VPIRSLVLILIAAFAHSTWNLLAKRASAARHLIWFTSLGEAILVLPAALWVVRDPAVRFDAPQVAALVATGILHLFYGECLVRGYRTGDLSIVYPVARGTGPLLSFVGAVVVLGERVSFVATVGTLCIAAGILVLARAGARGWQTHRRAIAWGAVTGVTIAAYTLVDGYAVRALLLPPVLVDYAGNLLRLLVLTVVALRERSALAAEYRRCWREALGISILTPVGYILVLLAMRQATVSHVAPAREVSMLIGAWFGTRLLGEEDPVRRLGGAALIGLGVVALVIG